MYYLISDKKLLVEKKIMIHYRVYNFVIWDLV